MSTLQTNTVNALGFAFPVHSSYENYYTEWEKIRDAIEGQKAVKSKTTKYLPKLASQKNDDYKSYLLRALFVNTTARILNTNTGTIVRRSPKLVYPPVLSKYFDLDSESFVSFKELFRYCIREVMQVSRVGVLVEINKKLDIPVPVRYTTENIINWRQDDDGNTVSILLAYDYETVDPSTYSSDTAKRYAELFLNDEGYYSIQKMDETKSPIGPVVTPSLRGNKLKYIPFVSMTQFGLSLTPFKPPIIDVVDINYSHFRTSADLETGRHFVGLPQPVITGATKEDKLYIGSTEALIIPSEKAKAFYLEFLGAGLGELRDALKEKEGQMAQFSAQLADTSSKGSEAEGTVRMRFSSDAANLTDIAGSVEIGLNRVYEIIADWSGEQKPVIDLNKDFISDKMTFNELREVTNTWLEGGYTDEEYWVILDKGEMMPSDKPTKRPKKKEEVKQTTSKQEN